MNFLKTEIIQTIKIILFAFVLTIGVNYVYAWTGPTQGPPNGNVSAPINVGTENQIKSAGLGIDALSVFGDGYLSGNLGIGTVSPNEKLDVEGNIEADAFLYSSDRRFKQNIQLMDENSFLNILKINPVYFEWGISGELDSGIIAQEVEEYFPEFVHTNSIGYKTVDYPKLIVPVLGIIKMQNEAILQLQDDIKLLKSR